LELCLQLHNPWADDKGQIYILLIQVVIAMTRNEEEAIPLLPFSSFIGVPISYKTDLIRLIFNSNRLYLLGDDIM
jgi:hypothetical protein